LNDSSGTTQAGQTRSAVVTRKPPTQSSVARCPAALFRDPASIIRRPRMPVRPEAVRELLQRCAQRLSSPDAWLQGAQSETVEGERTLPESSDAECWDLLGVLRCEALRMCGGETLEGPAWELYLAAAKKLAEALVEHLDCRRVSRDPPTALAAWNDAEERTHDQILNLFALAG
jgi:hypothetical protein